MGLHRKLCGAIIKERTAWAVEQMKFAAKASKNLGLNAHATFSGSLMWHTVYPWPQRPAGLVEDGFKELAKRWLPILNAFDKAGVDLCYEIHPGEDLHDGITFERFWEATGKHTRCNILYDPSHFVLQQLDYLQYIDFYHQFIKMFHVKDAEFNPSGRSGVYGGYQDWVIAQEDSDRWAMGRLTLNRFSQSLRNMVMTAGLCWNGNARSNIPNKEQRKGSHLLRIISSG